MPLIEKVSIADTIINYNYSDQDSEACEEHQRIVQYLQFYSSSSLSTTIYIVAEGKNDSEVFYDSSGNQYDLEQVCRDIEPHCQENDNSILLLICYAANNGLAKKIDQTLANILPPNKRVDDLFAAEELAKTSDILGYLGTYGLRNYKNMADKVSRQVSLTINNKDDILQSFTFFSTQVNKETSILPPAEELSL